MAFTMKHRQLDANHDPVFGTGQAAYLSGTDAVAQAIQTRLLLFQGEWWEDAAEGIPFWQSLLGVMGIKKDGIDNVITGRIGGTWKVYGGTMAPVTGIANLSTALQNREYSFSASVSTVFSAVQVSYPGGA